ncbi:MAG TPA: sialate O-acetylesterase [Puia sp.]
MKKSKLFIGALAALLTGGAGYGQVKVPRLISDGMVLQREIPIRIWGWASPGEKITVKFGGETVSGETDDRGKWQVVLSPKKAGGPYVMDINGINHIWLKNIMVGEVWVCSGQSNMELPMERVKEKYPEIIAHSENTAIRQFRVPQKYDFNTPHDNLPGAKWESASPETIGSFSAVAYFFARELNEHYHVPVGLITAAVGGTPDEAWLSADALRSFPGYAAEAGRYADSNYVNSVLAGGMTDEHVSPQTVVRSKPMGLYNGMIAPLTNYTIRGVIWYQGEANVSRAKEYQISFPALINDWRRHWNEGIFPFLFVQLAGYGPVKDKPEESQIALLREAQRMALVLPKTGMAVAMDLGDSNDIHPLNKEDVGKRLALSAEHVAYDAGDMIWTGPLYHSMKIKGERVHIIFKEADRGLIVKGGGELHGFEIAGADNHFVPAKAVIDGKNVVIVSSDAVPHPTVVRYAWADNPVGANLYNRDILFHDGLPAPSFEARPKEPKGK